jgi:hypothetical protein
MRARTLPGSSGKPHKATEYQSLSIARTQSALHSAAVAGFAKDSPAVIPPGQSKLQADAKD